MPENPDREQAPHDVGPLAKRRLLPTALKVLVALGLIAIAICLLLPAVRYSRPAALRNQCTNNLRQIAIALRAYADAYQALPPAYTTDADGKPLHSWRTLLLPFVEETALYRSIDLTKPWDDDANAEARNSIVSVYHCPSLSDADNQTTYLAVVTPHSCFQKDHSRRLAEIVDGASTTMMLIEVDSDHAVPWMAPMDADEAMVLGIGPQSPLAHSVGMNAAFVDGSVRFLFAELPAAQRLALISIAGNDQAAAAGSD
jgi:prepilin-type processing-associated H-X9-DG protein